jgi:glutathione synthase
MTIALFLADPPENYPPAKDSTRVLMEAAARRGRSIFVAGHADLEVRDGRPIAVARPLSLPGHGGAWFAAGAAVRLDLDECETVWFRADPPFDDGYLNATRIVDLAARPRKINDPAGLRAAGEKLFAMRWPELAPATLLTADPAAIRGFLDEVAGEAVVKPLDGFGGQGIFRLRAGDPNLRALLQTVTKDARQPVIVQAYLAAAAAGDKRILLWDGAPIGAFLRIPVDGEFRGNMMQGGRVEACDLDAADHAIIARLGPTLRQHGLRLVGLDVIGGRLTEVNVTSPTGFQEVRTLTGVQSEDILWDALARELAA